MQNDVDQDLSNDLGDLDDLSDEKDDEVNREEIDKNKQRA